MALTLTDDQTTALLDALGLAADATDVQLVVDTAKDLAARAEALDLAKPSTVAAAVARNGLEAIDKDTAEALRPPAGRRRGTRNRQGIGGRRDPLGQDHPVSPRTLGDADPGRSRHDSGPPLGAQRDHGPAHRTRPLARTQRARRRRVVL